MDVKIKNVADIYNNVKDLFVYSRDINDVCHYKYSAHIFNVTGGSVGMETITHTSLDVRKRLIAYALVDSNPIYAVMKWYSQSLIYPTYCRLINEDTQGVLLRITIGMIYKLPIALEDKQTLYNDCIENYKKVKQDVDSTYVVYLKAYDNLPF